MRRSVRPTRAPTVTCTPSGWRTPAHSVITLVAHTAIVDAIAAGDPGAAREAMRLHVESSQERVLAQFDTDPAPAG
ncbi:MAG: FCD domain-containing protein [Microbacteriaceae bacterium]|nr:MAG: FCD domain-containing protein [Microbacteriaceae bacterium]